MCVLELSKLIDDEIKRLIPRRTFEATVSFDKRIKQPIRMVNLKVGGDTLWTESALVNRKIITGLNTDDVVSFYQ